MYFSITIYNKTCNYLNTKPTQRKFIQTKDQKLSGEEVFFITFISPVYNNISTLSYCASLTPTYPILLLKSWETSSVQSHKKSTHSQHLHRKPSSLFCTFILSSPNHNGQRSRVGGRFSVNRVAGTMFQISSPRSFLVLSLQLWLFNCNSPAAALSALTHSATYYHCRVKPSLQLHTNNEVEAHNDKIVTVAGWR